MAFLLGQGWLAVGPILHGGLTTRKKNISLLQELPLMLMSGLIINYGLTLGVQSITISLVVGSILSIIGTSCFVIYVFRYHTRQTPTRSMINKWIGTTFICLLFLSPILTEPLTDWDARSIWFFHAKMIYAADSIGQSAGWQQPSVGFSHPDYPNLIPALAAQVADVMGFWNEYIPKASLFFILVPAVALLFTFARRSISFIFLLLLILFSSLSTATLWNGYMDGYLALYFSIGMLLLGRYIASTQSIDLVSCVCCLIILPYIKNEGALATLTGIGLLTFVLLRKGNLIQAKSLFIVNWKYFLAGLLALIPFALWGIYKQQWNLSNDLEIGTTQSFLRIFSRLTDGSYKLIFQSIYLQIEGALLLVGLLYIASVALNMPFVKESLPALLAAGIFCLGMIIIYLLTPADLVWQLSRSIDRTMLSVNGCIFIGSYYILNAMENKKTAL